MIRALILSMILVITSAASCASKQQPGNLACGGDPEVFAFPEHHLCASISEWVVPAVQGVPGKFHLDFWEDEVGSKQGPFVQPNVDEVRTRLYMVMGQSGHGPSKVPNTGVRVDASGVEIPGRFVVDSYVFSMKGKWQIIIELYDDGKLVEDALIEHEVAEK